MLVRGDCVRDGFVVEGIRRGLRSGGLGRRGIKREGVYCFGMM